MWTASGRCCTLATDRRSQTTSVGGCSLFGEGGAGQSPPGLRPAPRTNTQVHGTPISFRITRASRKFAKFLLVCVCPPPLRPAPADPGRPAFEAAALEALQDLRCRLLEHSLRWLRRAARALAAAG